MPCERERKHGRDVEASTGVESAGHKDGVYDASIIRREQSGILASQRVTDAIALLIFSIALLFVLWPVADRQWLIIWFLAVFCLGLLNCLENPANESTHRHVQSPPSLQALSGGWLGSALTGALWGAAICLYPSMDATQIGFLLSLHLSYLLLGTALRTPSLPVLHGFVGGAAVTSAIGVLIRHDMDVVQRFPLALLAFIGLIAMGHLHYHQLTRQIRLRLIAGARAERHESERDQAHAEMLRKNRFLAAASHDLRQPVYAIGLLADLLEMHIQQHDTKGVVGKLQDSITSLSSLFDGILDISRLDADMMENDPQHIRLDPLLKRLQSEYELLATAKGLSLNMDTSSGRTAHVDPMLLQRVLMNLVSNAIKFTDQGSIVVSVEPRGEQLSIKVSDTGCGIASDQLDNIFVEYQQLHTDHGDPDGGRGLGLAIVKRLCHLMGIQIGLRSTPGIGTEFTLLLASGSLDTLPNDGLHYCNGAPAPLSTGRSLTIVAPASNLVAEVA